MTAALQITKGAGMNTAYIPTVRDMPLSIRCGTAINAIRKSMTVDTPEARLFCAVIEQAIRDVASGRELERRSAINFLSQKTIWHAELLGIDSEYLHRVLRELEIL